MFSVNRKTFYVQQQKNTIFLSSLTRLHEFGCSLQWNKHYRMCIVLQLRRKKLCFVVKQTNKQTEKRNAGIDPFSLFSWPLKPEEKNEKKRGQPELYKVNACKEKKNQLKVFFSRKNKKHLLVFTRTIMQKYYIRGNYISWLVALFRRVIKTLDIVAIKIFSIFFLIRMRANRRKHRDIQQRRKKLAERKNHESNFCQDNNLFVLIIRKQNFISGKLIFYRESNK